MTDITHIHQLAELALASYANLLLDDLGDPNNIQRLTNTGIGNAGMTVTQALRLAQRVPIVVARIDDDTSGFSATAFRDSSGNLTLAIRGSETGQLADLAADADILTAGAAYSQIVAMVNWWKRVSTPAGQYVDQYRLATYAPNAVPQGAVVIRSDEMGVFVLEATGQTQATGEVSVADADGRIDVTGHSLGGHLAMAFSTLVPRTGSVQR